ncbi:hypothetical protein CFP56_020789 [Quercus suber]|uniref:Uncharacterized protein n=1 Tax=Quercus suber TaxID=58331 RepID=A0AAW0KIL9_QUESU|nr:hypothetical protein CFP56_41773 [Quercus suber]
MYRINFCILWYDHPVVFEYVHERFTRYKAEAVAARNEKDEAHAREAEARELLRIAKCKAEKTKLALRIAEDKVYKYRLALFLSWTELGVYYVFSTVFGGHGHTQLCLPWPVDGHVCNVHY